MLRRLTLATTGAHRGMRLDDVLAAWLPAVLGLQLSRSALRRLVMAGAIRVGGRPLRRPGYQLQAGTGLEALVDLERLAAAGGSRDVPTALTEAHILYEDDVLIAVDKPAGLLTHPAADARRKHLFGLVKELLARRGSGTLPSGKEPYLGLHQRLDRDTSGVVLFTKDPAANPPLASLFAGHAVVKTYHALAARPARLPPRTWRVDAPLASTGNPRRPVVRAGDHRSGAGLAAETEFELVEVFRHGLLVAARPKSGRKHQVRVHLAERGLPILGDAVYGGAAETGGVPVPRAMLHALRLAFPHPLSGAPLLIESPYPADFRLVLAALRTAGAPARRRRPPR